MLQDQIKRHNDTPGKSNHIEPNKMMVTSSQFGDGIVHWGMGTPNMLLNFARGINLGDKMTLCMDGTFGTCSSETCLYGVRYGMMADQRLQSDIQLIRRNLRMRFVQLLTGCRRLFSRC